jgi:hypothetical protein
MDRAFQPMGGRMEGVLGKSLYRGGWQPQNLKNPAEMNHRLYIHVDT